MRARPLTLTEGQCSKAEALKTWGAGQNAQRVGSCIPLLPGDVEPLYVLTSSLPLTDARARKGSSEPPLVP